MMNLPASLRRRLRSARLTTGRDDVTEPGTGRKMSEVLAQFIQPYQELAPARDALELLVSTAALAWNASLLPADERSKFMTEADRILSTTGDNETAEDFESIMSELIERKERFFAHDRRIIVSYELQEAPGGYRLVVASAREDVEEHGTDS